MKRLLSPVLLLLGFVAVAQGQYVKVLSVASQSGKIITSGVTSTTSAAKTFPGATVTIYSPSGSGTVATIYSTISGTVHANPFSASSTDATIDFFIAPGSTYDIRVSGVSAGVAITAFTRSGFTAPGQPGSAQVICGGVADATTIQNAINYVSRGTVFLSAGTCALGTSSPAISIPQYVVLRGMGKNGTILSYGGTGNAIQGGSSTAVYKFGISVEALQVVLTSTGTAIHLERTSGAHLDDVAIEGVVSGTNKGIVIEGGSTGGIGNILTVLKDVYISHVKTGIQLSGTGLGGNHTTSVRAYGCTVNGDLVAGSAGIVVDAQNGDGSSFYGTNVESFAIGVNLPSEAAGNRFYGTRFESNTVDVFIGVLSSNNVITGSTGLDDVTNNSGGDFNANQIYANNKTDNSPFPDTRVGTSQFSAFAISDIPVKVVGRPGQTADILQAQNSAGTTKFRVTKDVGIAIGEMGNEILAHFSATQSLDFAAWAGNDCQTLTMAVTGATTGGTVVLGLPDSLASIAGVAWSQGWVSAGDTVSIKGCKITAGASANPAAATIRADVWLH